MWEKCNDAGWIGGWLYEVIDLYVPHDDHKEAAKNGVKRLAELAGHEVDVFKDYSSFSLTSKVRPRWNNTSN